MEKACEILQQHQGRDRVIRTAAYGCYFLAGCTKGRLSERLRILGTEFSDCRTTLRLLDDILMLQYNIQYGSGKSETDKVIRILSVAANLVDQLFYPLEHIAWAADKRILRLDSSPYWYSSTFLWGLSLYLNILNPNEPNGIELDQQIFRELLSLVEWSADLCNAIHWMPNSFLWGGKFRLWQVGLLGLVSSLIGAYKLRL